MEDPRHEALRALVDPYKLALELRTLLSQTKAERLQKAMLHRAALPPTDAIQALNASITQAEFRSEVLINALVAHFEARLEASW